VYQYAKTFIVLTLLTVFLSPAVGAQTVLKIGYVDYDKIVKQWPEANEKLEQLKTRRDTIQAEMEVREAEIEQLRAEIESKEGMFSSREEEQAQQEEFRRQVQGFMDEFRKKQEAFEQESIQARDEVFLMIKKVVQDVAERNGYSLILRKRDLVYSVERYDITEEVIQDLDRR
jgi:outer membrane protein